MGVKIDGNGQDHGKKGGFDHRQNGIEFQVTVHVEFADQLVRVSGIVRQGLGARELNNLYGLVADIGHVILQLIEKETK